MKIREIQLYVCADCPCSEEGNVEGDFYCKHPTAPAEAAEKLPSVFDAIPSWCPIRSERTVLVISKNPKWYDKSGIPPTAAAKRKRR